ncbi:maleylpyruvate isomerase [Streptoalloteichus tenebrarius]|uniref:Maleylpyruvate isomerase n=1 Tax=Streptoalloteichus tenebrarius (strain ATCC 17920 / DSM 40477 / JCM 4838 / CBS 697.72 / NBRC 16177 / NCIMB 11028 / NRRL B-12390 / A12253. 1 / ISP 5477) TaxID=1933 RepID=A0ABT1HSH1_STRSD|nr:maleylpyruvate isomerase family mycothiol-dependent enzyme [Streptoalloteichus tenebrarius]MCP2258459.1 maleylpyruvate isomerase [Streptoalloteichus tenebrarius]
MSAAETRPDLRSLALARSAAAAQAAGRATAGLTALDHATGRLLDVVERMDEATAHGSSLCPGWTRAHVITHLARNADALVNLLTWARTGIEHQMYASRADRDADIEEGAARHWRLLAEDLRAACERFTAAAARLTEDSWRAEVVGSRGRPIMAYDIPWMRLREVWVHLVDLDRDVGFGDIPDDHLKPLLDDAVVHFRGRADVPPMRLHVDLPDGSQRVWEVLSPVSGNPVSVRGQAASVLAWLTGRGDGMALAGELPDLPPWI